MGQVGYFISFKNWIFTRLYYINYIMHQSNQEEKFRGAQQTLQMLECGIININFPIQYGIIVLGLTLAGKTTTCHYLCNQVLEGVENNAQSTVYKLKMVKDQYEGAKIADLQSVSETQIPNFFINNLDGKKVYLIDCPGYFSSFGFYKNLSNMLFMTLVFSKVQHTKFLITLTYNDILKTGNGISKTFKQFFQGFKYIEDIKQEIFNSTSIMVTSVPSDKKLQVIISLLKKDFQNKLENQLIDSIIKGKRIYLFEIAELGKIYQTKNNLLQKIDSNSSFWNRKIDYQKQADMKNINVYSSNIFYENERLRKQSKLFEEFFQLNINKQIQNLIKVIHRLTQDCYDEESAKFIQQIIAINKQKKQRRKNKSMCRQLYQKYQQKRNLFKKSILNLSQNLQTSFKNKHSSFWLCKCQFIKQFQRKGLYIYSQDSLEQRQKYFEFIHDFLCSLVNIKKNKKEKNISEDNQKNQALLDFVYQNYKIFKIYHMLYKLASELLRNNCQIWQKIAIQARKLYQIFSRGLRSRFFEIFQKGYENFIIDQNLTTKEAIQYRNFFQNYRNQLQQSSMYKEQQPIINNLNNMINTLNYIQLQSIKEEVTPNIKLLKNMQQMRQNILKQKQKQKQKCIDNTNSITILDIKNNRIIQLMALCLFKNGFNRLAIYLYDALFDGHQVLQVMESQQNIKRNQMNDIQYMEFLISYMKLAKKYHRVDLVMKKGQHALHIAWDKCNAQKINQISSFLQKSCNNNENNQKSQFQAHLSKGIAALQLPENIIAQIMSVSQPEQKALMIND